MDEDKKGGGLNEPAVFEPKEYRVTCPNCKEKVVPVNMMCPECHHFVDEKKGTTYQPLSKKTKRTVKIILTVVLLAVFALLVFSGVIKLDACETTEKLSDLNLKQSFCASARFISENLIDKCQGGFPRL